MDRELCLRWDAPSFLEEAAARNAASYRSPLRDKVSESTSISPFDRPLQDHEQVKYL